MRVGVILGLTLVWGVGAVAAKGPSAAHVAKLLDKGASCKVVQASRCEATRKLVALGQPAVLRLRRVFSTVKHRRKAVAIAALADLNAVEMGGAILRQIGARHRIVRHAAIIATARLMPPGSVKALAKAMGATAPAEKAIVAAALGHTRSPGAMQPLLRALKHPNPRLQMTAVQALAQLGQKGTFEALDRFARKTARKLPVRKALLKAYARLGDKRATPWVIAQLQQGDATRKEALRTLQALRDPAAVTALLPMLKESAWTLEVLNILGLTGSEKALPALIRLIRERETSLPVLQKAFWAIGETGSVSVVATLLPFLKDPKAKIVAWAAGALGQIGDKSAAMGLFLALKHDDTEVKHMAVWALEKLSGKRLGTEATRWETWVREQTPRR